MPTPTDRPPTRPPRTPRRASNGRPPSPPDPALQQRAWAALSLSLLSLLGLSLAGGLRRAIYVIIATLVLAALAAWLGGTAMSRARRAGSSRPRGAMAAMILGILGLAFSAITLIVFTLFWNELSAYSNCLSGANTLTAQQACQHQFSQTITNEIRSIEPTS
jgi:predicted PurR-regulated permease PerM